MVHSPPSDLKSHIACGTKTAAARTVMARAGAGMSVDILLAERVGFEPTDPFEGVTALAVRPLRPDSGTSPPARLSLELSRSHRESLS